MSGVSKKQIRRQALETYYVEGDTSLREAAAKFEVAYSTARRWAKADGWDKQRAEFLRTAQRKAEGKRADAVETKARVLSIQQHLTVSTSAAIAAVVSARNRAVMKNPSDKNAVGELREAVQLQREFDELVLATIGNLESAKRPAESHYHVIIGDRINDASTRYVAKHYDEQGREVDDDGNLVH